jgi:tRNA-dihydrouridine synthase 3
MRVACILISYLILLQFCGAHPDTMTRCAELLHRTIDVDFIDVNVGCPIDLIFKKGEGSALMGRHTKFEQIVRGMTSVLDIPLTVKIRTGIYDNKAIAHTIVPKLRDWGASLVTVIFCYITVNYLLNIEY